MSRLVAAFAASVAVALLAPLSPCLAIEPRDVPSPRPAGWVTDAANVIPANIEATLNRLGEDVHRAGGAELAVVTVRTIDGRDPRRFATELFNHWGIGNAAANNGLLVFVAIDDRAAEIILGDGIDQTGNVRIAEDLMQDIMVPRFRSGDPAGAIERGTTAAAEQILKFRRAAAQPNQPPSPRPRPAPRNAPPRELPPVEAEAPIAAPSADALPPVEAERRATPPPVTRGTPTPRVRLTVPPPGGGGSWAMLGLGAVLLGGLGAAGAGAMLVARLGRPPACPQCRQPMIQLDEFADDAHLDAAEQAEERVGSVNHVVWYCVRDNRVVKTSRGRWFSGYSHCPGCGAKTLDSESTVLEHATYTSTGLMRYDERCAHCDYTHTDTRIIPRMVQPSTHSSSRSHSSFGSSGSSGRSSGFSGGSSSGRGASGRW